MKLENLEINSKYFLNKKGIKCNKSNYSMAYNPCYLKNGLLP